MFVDSIIQIKTYFRNLTLNALGVERNIFERLEDNDVDSVVNMMEQHDFDVDNAISEYNPQTHKVMSREDKWVKGEKPYRTEKLARTRQRYINEVELFFLLGNPIMWKKVEGDDEAFELYKKYLKNIYFNTKLRQCKRLAGAETESGLVFNFSQKNGEMHVDVYVAARSKGHKMRELFDQYGNVVRKQMQKEGSVAAGSPVYKLVTSNDWSIVVKLDDSYYQELKDKTSVRVTITKDDISFNAQVKLWDKDGTHFAALSTSRYMERYINDRFLQIEFNLKSASGLKIPNSSVLKKNYYLVPKKYAVNGDDGIGVTRKTSDPNNKAGHEFVSLKSSLLIGDNYYVGKNTLSDGDILITKFGDSEQYRVHETGELSGVYYVNQGYCQFRPIEVLYKNKEYSIVSDHTVNGLSAYDHIVVDPTYLNDDDFIE